MKTTDIYEKAWAGKHGDEYTKRCDVDFESRIDIFGWLLDELDIGMISRILEVGCNKGHNLSSLQALTHYSIIGAGLEINKSLCVAPGIVNGTIYDIPWSDNVFDIVFSSGVLIHIPPKRLDDAIKEMRRASNKYILMIEYHADVEKGFRYEEDFDHGDGCWHRPYGKIYESLFPKDKLIKSGKISDLGDDGWAFSKCNYWVYEK